MENNLKRVGKPPIFKSETELIEKIEQYFLEYGEKTTITGLCLFLGFESRQSFYDYEKNEKYSYIIKRARLMIENGYEIQAMDSKTPTFQIFALKNMGWSDKQELDHTTQGDKIEAATKIVFTNGNKAK